MEMSIKINKVVSKVGQCENNVVIITTFHFILVPKKIMYLTLFKS